MTDPTTFARQFAAAFGAQDSGAIAALFAPQGSLHSLTGRHLEGRAAIEQGLAEEFAGLSRMARLVTGRASHDSIGEVARILHQRFVVTGLRDAAGQDLPRMGALLTVVLVAGADGWQAHAATFAVLDS